MPWPKKKKKLCAVSDNSICLMLFDITTKEKKKNQLWFAWQCVRFLYCVFFPCTYFLPLFLSSLFSCNLFAPFFLSCSSSDAKWRITRSGSVSCTAREMERLLSWRRRKRGSSQSSCPEIFSEVARATRRRSSACQKWREVSSEINIYCIHRVVYMLLFENDLGIFRASCPCFSSA